MLPPRNEAPVEQSPFILIGQRVPDSLRVTDATGARRSLLSFKVPSEILVVEFLSAHCPNPPAVWKDLNDLYRTYEGWHVGFIGISANTDETLPELAEALHKAGLPYAAVRDESRAVMTSLRAAITPEIMILDEGGYLRYRGPLKRSYVHEALDAVIGHVDSVPNPEPTDLTGCPIQ